MDRATTADLRRTCFGLRCTSSACFTEALDRSLAFAGPDNYCPVLVGAIGGVRWGAAAIPQTALAHVDILPRVKIAADALAAGWAG